MKWRQNKASCATDALGCAPQSGLLRLVQSLNPGSWRAALHSSERVPLVLQRPLQHLARVVRQGAASLGPPVGFAPAQAPAPAPGALAPQRFVTREATMRDVAPASAPLPQPARQHRAASAAGTGSGDVAMANAPAQQLRLPRRSAPRASAMADAPPLRLPPPRPGPARAQPAEHPAAQPDIAMADAAALSPPQLPAHGRPGPAFFFFFQGRSCLTGDSARPQRKACKTSVTAPPPKERARKGVPSRREPCRAAGACTQQTAPRW